MAEAGRGGAGDSPATAIGQYVLGEISLGKPAENAGMTRWQFEELLKDAGFDALYGPRFDTDLQDEGSDRTHRTIVTGTADRRATFSATLPSNTRETPPRP